MARRVIFDTNVLVSGYLWRGSARKALEFVEVKTQVEIIKGDPTDDIFLALALFSAATCDNV